MRRRGERIDYSILHKTGARVHKSSDSSTSDSGESEQDLLTSCCSTVITETSIEEVLELSSLFGSISFDEKKKNDLQSIKVMSTKEEVEIICKDIAVAQQTIADDINDYIGENALIEADVDELDDIIRKIEELRTSYRTKHNELKVLANVFCKEMFEETCNEVLVSIKNYIVYAKDLKRKIKNKYTKKEQLVKISKCNFLINEVSMLCNHLRKEFDERNCNALDDEISRRNANLPDAQKQMDSASKLIQELLSLNILGHEDSDADIKDVTDKYNELCKTKEIYFQFVKKQVEIRELTKQDLFKEGKLKINLAKFYGYDSKLDYYTFKQDFEKLCKRTTPKQLLPDVLKNNYLDGPALALVHSLTDIDEIWDRLRSAYGDPKMLLKKTLMELDKYSNISKLRDSKKLITLLSKLINIIRDLMKLASNHDIEAKLYSGHGIDKIYSLSS